MYDPIRQAVELLYEIESHLSSARFRIETNDPGSADVHIEFAAKKLDDFRQLWVSEQMQLAMVSKIFTVEINDTIVSLRRVENGFLISDEDMSILAHRIYQNYG